MRGTGVTTNLTVADIDAYTDYLGLNVEDLNLGWAARYMSPNRRACTACDPTSPQDSVISVHVRNDVHPLTD